MRGGRNSLRTILQTRCFVYTRSDFSIQSDVSRRRNARLTGGGTAVGRRRDGGGWRQAAAGGRVPILSAGKFMSILLEGCAKKRPGDPVTGPGQLRALWLVSVPEQSDLFRISRRRLEQRALPKMRVSRRRNSTL